MDLQLIPITQFQDFLLCLARVLSLISAIPVFSGGAVAMRLKVGIAFTTALLLFPAMSPYSPEIPEHPLQLGLLLINEVLLGLLIGLVARLVLTGVSFGGTIIGYQMGFAAANIFDPQTTQQLSLMSQFINIFSLMIFLSLDVHHFFFQAILDSIRLFPPGYLDLSGDAVPKLVNLGSNMFVLGVKFSAPVLVLLLITNFVLGILARVFPQLNVFMLSFPINIGTSLFVIGLTLTLTRHILGREFDIMGHDIMAFFSIFGG